MNNTQMDKLFRDTEYIRTGGSKEERTCAEYLVSALAERGFCAYLDEFEVAMSEIKTATLTIGKENIACKGYFLSGSGEVEAPIYYLTGSDKHSLSLCKDKIVMIDGYLGYWRYKDMLEAGALGFITYDGNVNYADNNIDQRELRPYVSEGKTILGVNINAKDAVRIIKNGGGIAKISITQKEYKGTSQNVILDLPGENGKTVIFTAHYDSTSLSCGSYDNMSGCVGLIGIAEYFKEHPHAYGLRFIFCGSEERGLLGSKAYCAAHEDTLASTDLVINLDMIGCTMGHLIACCTTEKSLVDYITYLGREKGVGIKAYQEVYSSDSTPFADKGVPAVSFARVSPRECATIHNAYDTYDIMMLEHMQDDIAFICAFTDRMVNAVTCPVAREIPADIKEKIDEYLCRKRKKQ